MRVYLDSSALLKRVLDENHASDLRTALRGWVRGGDALMSSALAWVEVSRAVRQGQGFPADSGDAIVDTALSGVLERPIGNEVVTLARLVGPARLRSLDAIHCASAMLADVDVLVTYDGRLALAATHNGLRVSAPGQD